MHLARKLQGSRLRSAFSASPPHQNSDHSLHIFDQKKGLLIEKSVSTNFKLFIMAQAQAEGLRRKGEIAGHRGMTKEAATGLVTGVAYGMTSPIVGHPFDTIKTKMQAEKIYAKSNAFQVPSLDAADVAYVTDTAMLPGRARGVRITGKRLYLPVPSLRMHDSHLAGCARRALLGFGRAFCLLLRDPRSTVASSSGSIVLFVLVFREVIGPDRACAVPVHTVLPLLRPRERCLRSRSLVSSTSCRSAPCAMPGTHIVRFTARHKWAERGSIARSVERIWCGIPSSFAIRCPVLRLRYCASHSSCDVRH